MMKLEIVNFFLKLPHLLLVGYHVRVTTTQLSNYLIDDELRVSADVKPLNLEFDGDA
jgi:hypothetical protein